jgi:hypothetical protein
MKTNIELAQEAGFMLDDASRLYTSDKDGDCHEQIHNLIDLVRVEAQPVIPPAFKLVPRSPTLKMLEAGEACYNRKDPRDSAKCIAVHVFRSMYDAAPTSTETKEQP